MSVVQGIARDSAVSSFQASVTTCPLPYLVLPVPPGGSLGASLLACPVSPAGVWSPQLKVTLWSLTTAEAPVFPDFIFRLIPEPV